MAAHAANCNADAATAAVSAGSTGSKRSFPGDDAAHSDRRVQPRHFHAKASAAAGPSSASGDGADALVEPDQPPPVAAARLHHRALESILAFLNLGELAVALRVSHNWLAAVKSMSSLRLVVKQPSVLLYMCDIVESALGRHVAQLGTHDRAVTLTANCLFILARHMTHLRALVGAIYLAPMPGRLIFPPRLQMLNVKIKGAVSAADVNVAIRAIGLLPVLECLVICLPVICDQLSLAPLTSLPQLRELFVRIPKDGPELSDAQVAQLRALPHLRRLDVQPTSTLLLRRLLAQPHNLQWQMISLPDPVDDEAAALLPQLPSLTHFGGAVGGVIPEVTCSRFDFLRQLPQLTIVNLKLNRRRDAGRMESLMAGLQCCSRMEELNLFCWDATAAHLVELLPRLPRLRRLTLVYSELTTLSFLAQPPMTEQLACLRLYHCPRLPLTELRYVHALKALKMLCLTRSFNEPMDVHCQSLHTPPSPLMPQLQHFEYTPPQP